MQNPASHEPENRGFSRRHPAMDHQGSENAARPACREIARAVLGARAVAKPGLWASAIRSMSMDVSRGAATGSHHAVRVVREVRTPSSSLLPHPARVPDDSSMPFLRLFGLALPALLPGGAAFALGRALPLPWAVSIYLAAISALALFGCRTLGDTFVRQRTLRDHLACRLLPFAQCMGGGSLQQVFMSSVLGTAAVGGLVFLLVFLDQRDALPPWHLALAFGLDTVTLLFLASAQTRTYLRNAPHPRRGRRLYFAVVLQVAIATALHLAGAPWLATAVAAGPQVLRILRSGLFVLAMH